MDKHIQLFRLIPIYDYVLIKENKNKFKEQIWS